MKSSILTTLKCPGSWMKFVKSRLQMFRLRDARLNVRNISIHEAIRHSDAPALARHISLNTNVNAHDKWGLTPLHIATEKGDARLVRILLGMGAEPALCSTMESGWVPPILVAASYGNLECLELLLEVGAPVDATDRWGNTAILKASSAGHFHCVSSLLEQGADSTITNHWGATSLNSSATLGFNEILTSLLNSGHYDVTSPAVQSALSTAASKGYHSCVEVLLNSGCPPGGDNEREFPSALFIALTYCAGDDLDYDDEDCQIDTKVNSAKCVTLLINAGAQITIHCLELLPDVVSQNGGKYFGTTIEVLSAVNLNLNEKNKFSFEHNAITQLLLQANTLTYNQQTEIIGAILKLGYKPSSEILNAIQENISQENVDLLIESGKEPPSLQNLCKLFVRSELSPNVTFAKKSLPLPVMMKKYL